MIEFAPRQRMLLACSLLLAALAVAGRPAAAQQVSPGSKPLRIHMIGAGEYTPQASLTKLRQFLEERYLVDCTASWGQENIATHLDHLDQLASADVLVVFARRMKLPEEQMWLIRRHWESGKPVVAMRTASHAFQPDDNAIFDRQVLGGHYGGASDYTTPFTAVPAKGQAAHRILQGVGPITSRGYYGNRKLADDAIVLQVIEGDARARPVCWTHIYQGGRTFYTSMGVSTDFENDHFKQLLANAIFWTSRRDAEELKRK